MVASHYWTGTVRDLWKCLYRQSAWGASSLRSPVAIVYVSGVDTASRKLDVTRPVLCRLWFSWDWAMNRVVNTCSTWCTPMGFWQCKQWSHAHMKTARGGWKGVINYPKFCWVSKLCYSYKGSNQLATRNFTESASFCYSYILFQPPLVDCSNQQGAITTLWRQVSETRLHIVNPYLLLLYSLATCMHWNSISCIDALIYKPEKREQWFWLVGS